MDLGVTSTTNSPVELFAGDFPRVLMPVTVVAGEGELAAGTVLGQVTASGKFRKLAANADGSETAKYILADAVDATAADVNTTAYATGEFNRAALTAITDAAELTLDARGIFVKAISQKNITHLWGENDFENLLI